MDPLPSLPRPSPVVKWKKLGAGEGAVLTLPRTKWIHVAQRGPGEGPLPLGDEGASHPSW